MKQSGILPFYMSYPLPLFYQPEDSVTRDLEYLRQMYPAQSRKYQKIIEKTLENIDYDGSMIYDEYPDRWQIYRLTRLVMERIRGSEEWKEDEEPAQAEELIQILLVYEIYRRRHTNRNGILKF